MGAEAVAMAGGVSVADARAAMSMSREGGGEDDERKESQKANEFLMLHMHGGLDK